jgi:hypothetical protein
MEEKEHMVVALLAEKIRVRLIEAEHTLPGILQKTW